MYTNIDEKRKVKPDRLLKHDCNGILAYSEAVYGISLSIDQSFPTLISRPSTDSGPGIKQDRVHGRSALHVE